MKYEHLAQNIRLLASYHNVALSKISYDLFGVDNRIYDIVNNKAIKIRVDEIQALADYFNVSAENLKNKKAYLEFK